MPWTCCKRRRLIIIKRWTDHEGFHAILKCRNCDWYERKDIPLKVSEGTETIPSKRRTISDITKAIVIEIAESQPVVKDIDVETGTNP